MKSSKIDPNRVYRAEEARDFIMSSLGIGRKSYYAHHHRRIPGWFFPGGKRRIRGKDVIAYIERWYRQIKPWMK